MGITSFGGPAAHIALMEAEFVQKRKWLSSADLLDLIGAANLIPGPNSTEVALHVGFRQRGYLGLVVAGLCFIWPATLLVAVLAHWYLEYQKIPQLNGVLAGIKPVVVVILLRAVLSLRKATFKTRSHVFSGVLLLIAYLAGLDEVSLVFAAAGIGFIKYLFESWNKLRPKMAAGFLLPSDWSFLTHWMPVASQVGEFGKGTVAPGMWAVFGYFLKIGGLMYGSGYVLVAFLNNGLVHRYGWLTQVQLLDAISIGQVTPGPLFTTATFIGYLLGGWWGSVVATVGIFLPAFVFVGLTAPFMKKLSRMPSLRAVLDIVNVASLVLMACVMIEIGSASLRNGLTWGIGFFAMVFFTRVPTTALIALGGVLGWLFG